MQRKEVRMGTGETQVVSNEWAAECEERGTSISSSTWTGSGLTLSNQALASNKATVKVNAAGSGLFGLENTVVLANGETLIATRDVWVS